jgi:hypothetical protein
MTATGSTAVSDNSPPADWYDDRDDRYDPYLMMMSRRQVEELIYRTRQAGTRVATDARQQDEQ